MSPTRDESQVLRSFCLGQMQSQLRPEMAVCLLQCTSVVHSFRVLGMVLKGNQLIGCLELVSDSMNFNRLSANPVSTPSVRPRNSVKIC